MITVDCHEVESIQNELLIYVADNVAAIPNIKYHEFVLSPIEEEGVIDTNEVVTSIKEFLESIGEQRNFAVISRGEIISIESILVKQSNVIQNYLQKDYFLVLIVVILRHMRRYIKHI